MTGLRTHSFKKKCSGTPASVSEEATCSLTAADTSLLKCRKARALAVDVPDLEPSGGSVTLFESWSGLVAGWTGS